MPSKYTRKTNRRSWDDGEKIQTAVREVQNGKSCNSIAVQFGIPESTLRRYVKKVQRGEDLPVHGGRFQEIFTEEQTQELLTHIKEFDKRAFGLTKCELRSLAFQFAEQNGIPHRFNKNLKMAGKDWAQNFSKKHHISLRQPESTSVGRLMGFNKVAVGKFFDLLKEVRSQYKFRAENIYNADESGISTVPTKMPKVYTPTGNRRVAKVTSAERGKNTTVVCAVNSVGHFVPPYFIFGRVRMKSELLYGAPAGSDGVAQKMAGCVQKSL